MIALVVLLIILAIVVFWVIGVVNRLVSLRNGFKNLFSQIDTQLKRRYELIPNLVEIVKGYMRHEHDTLEAVIVARNHAFTASSKAGANPANAVAVQQLAAAELSLLASLSRLFALSESCPDLQSNQNLLQLTEELSGTENKIAFARQAFNEGVTLYNTGREQFPGSLIANLFGFQVAQIL